jgi:hypothetical protein
MGREAQGPEANGPASIYVTVAFPAPSVHQMSTVGLGSA